MYTSQENIKPNGKALLPLAVFFLTYILTFIFTGDLSNVPVIIAFLLSTIVSLILSKGTINHRVNIFCRGAGNETIMLMVVIFILAGAFAGGARAMGAVDATVNMVLSLLPQSMIPASIFIAACFISMSMGTSCGTIVALTPIAVGLSPQIGMSLPAMVGIVVGGSMFGDNLSFISDTTIVATRTQGVKMTDKFKANIWLVAPMAIIVTLVYVYQGFGLTGQIQTTPILWEKVIPYLVVLITAIAGVNVIVVLIIGILLTGVIGLFDPEFSLWSWIKAANSGIVNDMGELIIVSMIAGGMFEVIRTNGGIDWLVEKLMKGINSKRRAEGNIAALICLTNICTANNTIALIIVGPIAKKISDTFKIDGRRTASLLDTLSCFVQGLLPYGAQLLIAASLAQGVKPIEIIPFLYYPFLIGIVAIGSIIFRLNRKNKSL
jgi:Na+/H+ antiporter